MPETALVAGSTRRRELMTLDDIVVTVRAFAA